MDYPAQNPPIIPARFASRLGKKRSDLSQDMVGTSRPQTDKQRSAVAAMLKTIFAQETKADAEAQWETVANALREKVEKLGIFMDASCDVVLAYMDFPREHWARIASTNPLERANREIKRQADVIGIFPNDEAIIRLVGALMLETNDEWAGTRRYMSLETLARVTDNPTVRLPSVAT